MTDRDFPDWYTPSRERVSAIKCWMADEMEEYG